MQYETQSQIEVSEVAIKFVKGLMFNGLATSPC